MPLAGKLTSFLLASTMLGGPLGAAFDSPNDSDDATLLAGETDGLAIDWTATADFALSTWAMQAVQERNASVDTFQSPHVFFTQSGTSPKYVKDSATTIGWSPHNFALRSQTLATAPWAGTNAAVATDSTTAPNGTTTAETLTAAAGNAAHELLHNALITVANAQLTYSAYLKYNNHQFIALTLASWNTAANWVQVVVDIQNGTITEEAAGAGGTLDEATITSVGSGWYRVSVTGRVADTQVFVVVPIMGSGTPTQGSFGSAAFNAAGTEAVYVWGAQLNRGFVHTAYMPTTVSAVIGLPISYGEGLLVEPAATNLLINSQNLAGAGWTNSNSTDTSDTHLSPDGSTTADTLTVTSVNGLIDGSLTATLNATYTGSVYLKAGTKSWASIQVSDLVDELFHVSFDIGNGAVGTTSGGIGATLISSSIASVGNGWYRCVLTGSNINDTNISLRIVPQDSDGVNASTGTIAVWGAQVEAGTIATSYIPTVAATATRALDNVNVATSAFGYSGATDTVLLWWKNAHANNEGQGTRGLLRIANDANDFIDIRLDNADPADGGELVIRRAGVDQADITTGTAIGTTRRKFGIAAQANDAVLYIDGTSIGTDATVTMPDVAVTTYLGNLAGGNVASGLMERFIYLPRRMANGDIDTATT